MAPPRHILLFRFSALGDVAMTVPVIKNLLHQYPDLQISFVSQPFMQPLFENIERLHFYPVDIKNKWKGITGIFSLAKQLKKDIRFDAIADLHDSLRTKLLRFFLIGKPVAVIGKGRKEKEELTRSDNKKLRPLKTNFQRYADVFEKLGFTFSLDIQQGIVHVAANKSLLPVINKNDTLIGVAPFAKHAAKMYPLDKMKEVVQLLSRQTGTSILLFGSQAEAQLLGEWEKTTPNVYSLAGKTNFSDELKIIAQLKVMISMDSANMHLASLYGVPVVSIWGGTHPFLGFYGWGQPMENAVQIDLPCRPSSVFGNKDCPVHGKAGCMQDISPDMIVEKVKYEVRSTKSDS